jgi:hypothetical protein
MTNRDVATLAFRLAGVWFVASGVIGFASLPYFWESSPEETRRVTAGFLLLPSLVTLGIGVPLWASAEWFASRTFPVSSSDALAPDRLRGETLVTTACTIIGIFFLADGLPAVVNSAALFVQSYTATTSILGRDAEQQRLLWNAAAKANTAAGVARLAIGVLLLLGPARLSATLAAVRKDLRGTLQDDEPGTGTPTPVNTEGVEQRSSSHEDGNG